MTRPAAAVLAPAMALLAGGCDAGMTDAPDNFTCAARLMAYAAAVRDGDIEHDRALFPASTMSVMYHLNAWAIPQGIGEPDACAKVNAEAARMREVSGAEELIEGARWCVENRPG